MASEKDIEEHHLNIFLNSSKGLHYFKELVPFKTIKNKNDPPDFIIATNNNETISIELTVLNIDSYLGRLQFSLDNVIKKVFKKIDNCLNVKYYMKLASLNFSVANTKLNENRMAEQIFDIISNPQNYEISENTSSFYTKSKRVYDDVYVVKFKNEYDNLFVLYFAKSKEKENFGGVALEAFGSEDNYTDVKKTILRKEQNLIKYKSKYNKNILLLVSDPQISVATIFKFTNKFYQTTFETIFDEIFLLDMYCPYNPQIHKLKIVSK